MDQTATSTRAGIPAWERVAAADHAVHLYDAEDRLEASLEQYVASGLAQGAGVVVIATATHLDALEARLRARAGINLDAMRRRDQYIAVDAAYALGEFMVDDWPDARRFETLVSALVERARGGALNRPVRAFGEMVVLLWQGGHHGATVRLEHLWRRISQIRHFSVYCAYPRHAFGEHAGNSLLQICSAHTHVFD